MYENGGLNLETWDGALAWLSILLGFFFLLRSSEYLRKGAEVDEQKCLRFRNLTWARDDSREDVEPGFDCDELIIYHEFSKNDFIVQGQDNNTKRCSADVRLCIPSLINKLRVMNPSAFEEKNRDSFPLHNVCDAGDRGDCGEQRFRVAAALSAAPERPAGVAWRVRV